MERERVDKIRTEIEENPWLRKTYEQEKIDLPPSKLRKFGRAALDALGIRLGFSEKRRNREAMSVAIGEIDAEQEEQESRRLEELKQEEDKKAELAKQEADRIKAEEEALQEDMEKLVSGTKKFREDFFRAQRLQEIVERDLNSRLLSVETLEEEVLSENPGVSKRSIPYEDTEIPVYDLKGLPFSMLSTAIDFKKYGPSSLGYQTSRAVMANPAIWCQRLDEAMKTEGFGTSGVNARGNVISASFYNSEWNITSHVYGELMYGFDHADAGSVISTIPGDGTTSNMVPYDDYYLSRLFRIRGPLSLDRLKKTVSGYNEVVIKRYSETGVPKRPDYIITVNGKISEASLRHAKFYNIPIVNIIEQPYFEKMDQRSEEIVDSMAESDSYDELVEKIADFKSTSRGAKLWSEGGGDTFFEIHGRYSRAYYRGYDTDITSWQDIAKESSLFEKVANKKALEHKKRLEYIKSSIQSTIASMDEIMDGNDQHTNKGETFSALKSRFDRFNITFRNEEEGRMYKKMRNNNRCRVFECLQGNRGYIEISFKDKNGLERMTEIHQDSIIYSEFASIVSNYLKTWDKFYRWWYEKSHS